jgi:metal-responsive CopG/Arc/MetJ family transcriptional regulator
MKTAVSLPDPLFHAAERLARRLGISRSQVFQRAVKAFLEAYEEASVTESLNAVYADEEANVGLDPVIEKLQTISLVREKW